jgi:hypothetical protein
MINEHAVWSLVLQVSAGWGEINVLFGISSCRCLPVGVKLTPECSERKWPLMKRWFSCLSVDPTPIPSHSSTNESWRCGHLIWYAQKIPNMRRRDAVSIIWRGRYSTYICTALSSLISGDENMPASTTLCVTSHSATCCIRHLYVQQF